MNITAIIISPRTSAVVQLRKCWAVFENLACVVFGTKQYWPFWSPFDSVWKKITVTVNFLLFNCFMLQTQKIQYSVQCYQGTPIQTHYDILLDPWLFHLPTPRRRKTLETSQMPFHSTLLALYLRSGLVLTGPVPLERH